MLKGANQLDDIFYRLNNPTEKHAECDAPIAHKTGPCATTDQVFKFVSNFIDQKHLPYFAFRIAIDFDDNLTDIIEQLKHMFSIKKDSFIVQFAMKSKRICHFNWIIMQNERALRFEPNGQSWARDKGSGLAVDTLLKSVGFEIVHMLNIDLNSSNANFHKSLHQCRIVSTIVLLMFLSHISVENAEMLHLKNRREWWRVIADAELLIKQTVVKQPRIETRNSRKRAKFQEGANK